MLVKLIKKFYILLFLFFPAFLLISCQTVDLYEKNVSIPKHEWHSSFKPQFKFTIKDTTVPYNIFIVLRHNEKYNYNNIWLSLSTGAAGDSVQKVLYEFPL